MIEIDGALGGGQVLRSSLALSVLTQQPFRIRQIRKQRSKPGLRRQHLTCVRAAAAVGRAAVTGDDLNSTELSFWPGQATAGDYDFDVQTAGSTTLVLQTVLPMLWSLDTPSSVTVTGGTHNPMAPSTHFLAGSFLPVLEQMGPQLALTLERPGFAPQGQGRVRVDVTPAPLERLELMNRGPIKRMRASVLLCNLDPGIATREHAALRALLELRDRSEPVERWEPPDMHFPGNACFVHVRSKALTEVFCGLGERGKPAEHVAQDCARQVERYLKHGAPVGRHLQDQLLLPLALGQGGVFRTGSPTDHTRSNAQVIQAFLPHVRVELERVNRRMHQVSVLVQ
jgi:RNA 3'-terminal phosphate cyclase (ATP)